MGDWAPPPEPDVDWHRFMRDAEAARNEALDRVLRQNMGEPNRPVIDYQRYNTDAAYRQLMDDAENARPEWLTVEERHQAIGYRRAFDLVAAAYHEHNGATIDQLLRSGRLVAGGPCPDCWVPVGRVHASGCDKARCLATGAQLISHDATGCEGVSCGQDVWTGNRYRDETAFVSSYTQDDELNRKARAMLTEDNAQALQAAIDEASQTGEPVVVWQPGDPVYPDQRTDAPPPPSEYGATAPGQVYPDCEHPPGSGLEITGEDVCGDGCRTDTPQPPRAEARLALALTDPLGYAVKVFEESNGNAVVEVGRDRTETVVLFPPDRAILADAILGRRHDAEADELVRLTSWLHNARRHPDYEYETTEGQRKAWDDQDTPPAGDGWERNVTDQDRDGWERFAYHEESYWRRRRTVEPDPTLVTCCSPIEPPETGGCCRG